SLKPVHPLHHRRRRYSPPTTSILSTNRFRLLRYRPARLTRSLKGRLDQALLQETTTPLRTRRAMHIVQDEEEGAEFRQGVL
ncbi:hypothetical protein A1F96_11401, partial [Pyrenophora tritici-repentis]